MRLRPFLRLLLAGLLAGLGAGIIVPGGMNPAPTGTGVINHAPTDPRLPTLDPPSAYADGPGDWPMFRHDPARTGYNPDETSLKPLIHLVG